MIYLNCHTAGLYLQAEKLLNNFLKHYKKHYREVLLNEFHLHVHTAGIHPQTQKLLRTTLYNIINSTTAKYCSIAFI